MRKKQLLILLISAAFLFTIAATAGADVILVDDTVGYPWFSSAEDPAYNLGVAGVGSVTANPQENVNPGDSFPYEEEAFLENLLDLVYDDSSVTYLGRDSAGVDFNNDIKTGDFTFSEGEDWLYAVVKYGTWSLAIEDEGNNILELSTSGLSNWSDIFGEASQLSNGVSHISYFAAYEPPPSVPEPATMFLLGTGLLGLAVIGRKKFR